MRTKNQTEVIPSTFRSVTKNNGQPDFPTGRCKSQSSGTAPADHGIGSKADLSALMAELLHSLVELIELDGLLDHGDWPR